MLTRLNAKGTLVAARVRTKDGEVGSLVSYDGKGNYTMNSKTNGFHTRIVTVNDIAECGDDVKFRTQKVTKAAGIVYVSMKSLVS